jgi:hypothetical protein
MSIKRQAYIFASINTIFLLLAGCSPGVATQIPPADPLSSPPATTAPAVIPSPTSLPATHTMPPPVPSETSTPEAALEPGGYPLAEPGPYYVGRRNYELVDAGRDNRQVGIVVWYPALLREGENGDYPIKDAAPAPDGAPYPLILSTTKNAGIFAPYLVSHGFAWVSVSGLDTYDPWDENLIIEPLDLLFALDQVAANPPAGLKGMLDTDQAGAMGYSYDGYNALALAGARIDPAFYLDACQADLGEKSEPVPMGSWVCPPSDHWQDFIALAGEERTNSQDGLWQPVTDERIRAVVPLAGEGWWLYGEKGLAAVQKPTLMIVGGIDFYFEENQQILETLGTDEKALISFGGQGHMMVYEKEMVARMAHFATAFFGYHLQGREDLAWYFSEEFVSQHEDLAWGVYEGD